ncbi:TonB-dependent receptor, partial [Hymenobacter sp. AT01-02]|uniref:TonB-dependent receptor n=1 Tax=Hymenobacter sp. AT01-02 TaxID=1571877 RepID=UPI000AFC92B6
MKCYTLFTALSVLLLSGQTRAQQPVAVTGTVHNATGEPLAFATVVLVHLPDSAATATQTTNELGSYDFARVAAGRYCLKAQLLSYRPARSAPFEVANRSILMPRLLLMPLSTTLQGVTVQGRLPALEQLADRTVLHVDRLNTAGDNALEVLRKAPGVQLDKDENIVYRGSTGLTVLLDGKLTYLNGEDLKAYLKSLPASAISQVELLPNPPASLDAAGTAGVLNIRLKRTQRPGLSGTATLAGGYGRYEKASGSTNLHYNVGRVRLFTRLSAGRYNSYNRLVQMRHIRDTVYRQVNYWHPLGHALNFAAGVEVPLTPRQTLGGRCAAAATPKRPQPRVQLPSRMRPAARSGACKWITPKPPVPTTWASTSTTASPSTAWAAELSADATTFATPSTADQIFANLAF